MNALPVESLESLAVVTSVVLVAGGGGSPELSPGTIPGPLGTAPPEVESEPASMSCGLGPRLGPQAIATASGAHETTRLNPSVMKSNKTYY